MILYYTWNEIWSQIFDLIQYPIRDLLTYPTLFYVVPVLIQIILFSIPLWTLFAHIKKAGYFFTILILAYLFLTSLQPILGSMVYPLVLVLVYRRSDEEDHSFLGFLGITLLIWVIIPFIICFFLDMMVYLLGETTDPALYFNDLLTYFFGFSIASTVGMSISVLIFALIYMLKIGFTEREYLLRNSAIVLIITLILLILLIYFGRDIMSDSLNQDLEPVRVIITDFMAYFTGFGFGPLVQFLGMLVYLALDHREEPGEHSANEDGKTSSTHSNITQNAPITSNESKIEPLNQASEEIPFSSISTYMVQTSPDFMQHTERVSIRARPQFPCHELKKACIASKNIFNSGNYILRKVWKSRKFPLLIGRRNLRQLILTDASLSKLYTVAKGTTRTTPAELAADSSDVLEAQKLLSSSELDVFVKACNALPGHAVQQLLKTLVQSWKSFFELERDVRTNPTKYDKRFKARPPQYKDKHEQWLLEFTSQEITLQTGEDPKSPKLTAPQQPKQFAYLHFPTKKGDKFSIIPPVRVRTDIFSDHFQASGGTSFLNHVRVIPRKNQYIIEVIYLKKKHPAAVDSDKCAAIDIGVNNLMTIITNLGLSPLFLSGRVIKAINQWYNKLRAEYKSKRDVANQHKLQQLEAVRKLQKQSFVQIQAEINNRISQAPNTPEGLQLIAKQQILLSDVTHFSAKTQDELYQIRNQLNHEVYTDSKDMQAITQRRKRQIDDILHKSTTYVINYCVKHRIGKLVVGYNPEWKQDVNLGKVTNQNFVDIPFARMIDMLKYKADMAGIEITITNEAYTSKCSAIDREPIGFHTQYKGKRVHRGLFESGAVNPKTNKRYVMNADVNGAFNIGRFVHPHLFQTTSIQSMILRPERVEIYS